MEIVVNGEKKEIAPGATLLSLIDDLRLPPSRVAVERNLAIVRKSDYAGTVLADGDRIEIVTFVGGG